MKPVYHTGVARVNEMSRGARDLAASDGRTGPDVTGTSLRALPSDHGAGGQDLSPHLLILQVPVTIPTSPNVTGTKTPPLASGPSSAPRSAARKGQSFSTAEHQGHVDFSEAGCAYLDLSTTC
jgi:hypothetical protein